MMAFTRGPRTPLVPDPWKKSSGWLTAHSIAIIKKGFVVTAKLMIFSVDKDAK